MPVFMPGHRPEAVLLLHGFTGVVGEMRYLGGRLNEAGFTVSIPRLPGHGTGRDDFRSSDRGDWLRRSVDAYLDLRSRFEQVYVAGLSMGGLLTIELAARFPIPRIALAAPAVTNSDRRIFLTPLLRFFIKKTASSYTEEESDPDRAVLADEYWRWRYPQQVYELLRLQLRARHLLPRVEADSMIIVSRQDRTVPMKAADIIEKKIAAGKIRRVVLQESSHVVVDGVEKARVADEVISWFSDGSSS